MDSRETYYEAQALYDRLTDGVLREGRPVVFLFGSALTAPLSSDGLGVLSAPQIVNLIRAEFSANDASSGLEQALSGASNPYQEAFRYLLGRRSQEVANEIIKRAVWKARKPVSQHTYTPSVMTDDQTCETLDTDIDGWHLSPAVEAVGKLAAYYPEHFGKQILTTNFDPLLEVAIQRQGGRQFRTVLQRDGYLSQITAEGCHIVHLHGYWHGADTLHTVRQLGQDRPRLKHSLAQILKDKTLLVCGYGGWDDVFTRALMDVALDDSAKPQILWTFFDANPQPPKTLLELLTPGLDRGRVTLYSDVDCHSFFPDLLTRWTRLLPPPTIHKPPPASSRLRVHISTQGRDSHSEQQEESSSRSVEDNPPLVDICVGREREITELLSSPERVCFVTGFGGHGKSTLAAYYTSRARQEGLFDKFVWVDCKEESERFENRLISILVREAKGSVSGNDLSHLNIVALSEQLVRVISPTKYLFIFDNIDHYVDLENNVLVANADAFLKVFLASNSRSRVIFTCRPSVQYSEAGMLSLRLEGLSVSATRELFSRREAIATDVEITQAHDLTGGHAFWLDLLAAQATKRGRAESLSHLLDKMRLRGEIPFAMLESIWPDLHENQKAVLQGMAETVKPETDVQIGEYLRFQMNFSRVNRALRLLRNQNLVVVRPSESGDAFELHPLVREFVRTKFPRKERLAFIDAILSVYARLMQLYTRQSDGAIVSDVLRNWTENAEICIAAGKFEKAFESLDDVRSSFLASEFPGEFARVARDLFRNIEWSDFQSYKKFDSVFTTFVHIVANFDRREEVESLLSQYAATVASRDARYINYCDLRCLTYWTQQRYPEAIEWGVRGKELKEKTNVDTQFDTQHNLALAQRDAGMVDEALRVFLKGNDLGKVIDPDEFDETQYHAFYGNVGRCLHLMGQIEPALVCYRKSAILLQSAHAKHIEDQGYIRLWIGELLIAKGEACAGSRFLTAARTKWELVSPGRNAAIDAKLSEIKCSLDDCKPLSERNVERYCVAWIFGRERDFSEV